jgi:hypothetical protein
MPISPENRERLLVASKGAAAAFVEDMAHIREVLAHEEVAPRHIRLLSGVLRRLLVDNDLRTIAPPRTGAVDILAPDNSAIYRAARKQPPFLFLSGGITVFNTEFRALGGPAGKSFVLEPEFDKSKTVALGIDGFLSQNVLAMNNEWANRRHVIKYIANIASGVHSSSPTFPNEQLLNRIRKYMRCSKSGNGVKIEVDHFAPADIDSSISFKWSATAIDFVLIELLSAAHFLSISPGIKTLESFILSELS